MHIVVPRLAYSVLATFKGEIVAFNDDRLLIKKEFPLFEDKPYLVIRMFPEGNDFNFYAGKYDLTRDQAEKILYT